MTLPRDFRDHAYRIVDEMIDSYEDEAWRICQSPIEVAFATAFLLSGYIQWGRVAMLEPKNHETPIAEMYAQWRMLVQRQIGPYRVDFLLTRNPEKDGTSVVIECDGHQWHERTKQQAEADKSRDRYLQAAGYKVFRFTGSEIYRNAFECAEEVFAAMMDRIGK